MYEYVCESCVFECRRHSMMCVRIFNECSFRLLNEIWLFQWSMQKKEKLIYRNYIFCVSTLIGLWIRPFLWDISFLVWIESGTSYRILYKRETKTEVILRRKLTRFINLLKWGLLGPIENRSVFSSYDVSIIQLTRPKIYSSLLLHPLLAPFSPHADVENMIYDDQKRFIWYKHLENYLKYYSPFAHNSKIRQQASISLSNILQYAVFFFCLSTIILNHVLFSAISFAQWPAT